MRINPCALSKVPSLVKAGSPRHNLLLVLDAQYVYRELSAVATMSGCVGCHAMFSTFQLKFVSPDSCRVSCACTGCTALRARTTLVMKIGPDHALQTHHGKVTAGSERIYELHARFSHEQALSWDRARCAPRGCRTSAAA
jgi:hypothetical protein